MPDKKTPQHFGNNEDGFIGRVREIIYPELFNVEKKASSTLLVEGLPAFATEREVAHIFRPFQGYKTVRIVPGKPNESEPKELRKEELMCFVDFESTLQTTAVINTV